MAKGSHKSYPLYTKRNTDKISLSYAIRYTVVQRLAEGGFSVIDLIENTSTKRKFALKRITCHSRDDENVAKREIEISKMVQQKNVVDVVDYEFKGCADIVLNTISNLDIVLPYFRNGTLADHLLVRSKTHNYMSEGQILQIFLGICEGLRAFHEACPIPLAHRDLKTANICLSDSMEPIIIDLGSASEAKVEIKGSQDAQRIQDMAEERCTITYRPPELFCVNSNSMIDERTDIFSLGCCLYALCYFKSPYDAAYERGDSVALAVMSGNINFINNAPYSQGMKSLIELMLSQNIQDRPFISEVISKTTDLINKLENRI